MALPKRIFMVFDADNELVDWNPNLKDMVELATPGDTVIEFKQIRRSAVKLDELEKPTLTWKESK